MDLVKGISFFYDKEVSRQYPYLSEDITTDVLVIGGGVTGALALWNFSQAGMSCVLADAGRFALRSTAITTALLQYELEDNFKELSQMMPEADAKEAYLLGLDALKLVDFIIDSLGNQCDYEKNDTILITNTPKEVNALRTEYENRLALGIPVQFFDENNNPTPFRLKAGVFSPKCGARLNPYLFAHQLLAASEKNHARLFENTPIRSLCYQDGLFVAQAEYGYRIKANKVVLSTGYEQLLDTNRAFCTKQITYNIAVKPLEDMEDMKILARDNKSNYHYFRQLPDRRIIFGGGDSKLSSRGIDKEVSEKKYTDLLNYLKESFIQLPAMPELSTAFSGVFGVTPDNLGVVGFDQSNQNLMYCLGYGANGILFAALGAKMLVEQLSGKPQAKLRLFDPFRPALAAL